MLTLLRPWQTVTVVSLLLLPSCGSDTPPVTAVKSAPAATPETAATDNEAPATPQTKGAPRTSNFADADFNPVARPAAVYRLERDFQEAVMLVEGAPTYDQGMMLKGTQTPMDRYVFNYHRVDDDTLAFSVQTIVLRDAPSQTLFDGAGVWYDRETIPTARGNFDGGKLHGKYETLDADGNVTDTKVYDKGVAYDPGRFAAAVYKPLVGTWVSDTKDGNTTHRLVNHYRDDGMVEIYNTRMLKSVLGGKKPPMETWRSKTSTFAWKFVEKGNKRGVLEYFDGTTRMGRASVELTGPDSMESRTTYHKAPQLVGKRYSFRRLK